MKQTFSVSSYIVISEASFYMSFHYFGNLPKFYSFWLSGKSIRGFLCYCKFCKQKKHWILQKGSRNEIDIIAEFCMWY